VALKEDLADTDKRNVGKFTSEYYKKTTKPSNTLTPGDLHYHYEKTNGPISRSRFFIALGENGVEHGERGGNPHLRRK